MVLVLSGPGGSARASWRSYASLRDNVQHYLEAGLPAENFKALHGLENAVDAGESRVDAAQLRREVLRATYALGRFRVSDAAVSLRTRSIMTNCPSLSSFRGTVRSELSGWRPAMQGAAESPLLGAAWDFVIAVLRVTTSSTEGGSVLVQREGPAPRSANVSLPV